MELEVMCFQKSFFYVLGQSNITSCVTEFIEVASINDVAFVN